MTFGFIWHIIKAVSKGDTMSKLDEVVDQFKDQAPELVKTNKGALMGAVLGYLLTDNKQAQSTILGLIAGSVLVDSKEKDEE